jgi:uncharacterized membrane protein YoaK (UPF0700 family)
MTADQRHFHFLSDSIVIQILAFVAGFVDTVGYLKFQVFTSCITGNLVVACASFVAWQGVICRACVTLSFTLAGGLLATLAIELKMYSNFAKVKISLILFCIEAAALFAAGASGLLLVSWLELEVLHGDLVLILL